MSRLKVYLDTSVISHLLQEYVPEKMADTRQLWEMFRAGKYDVYLSTITLEEIEACSEPKRDNLYKYLEQINYELVQIDDKLREYNYYQTKDMKPQERLDYYNNRGLEVHKIIQERKLQKT